MRKLRDLARDRDRRPFFLVRLVHQPARPVGAAAALLGALRPGGDRRCRRSAPIPREQADPHSLRLRDMSGIDEAALTDEQVRRARHGYYAAISYVDERIGEVLARARARPAWRDDTIVLFTADHGEMLGERGLWYKMAFFEPVGARAADRLGAGPARRRARGRAGVAARPRADAARAVRAPARPSARGLDGRSLAPRAGAARRLRPRADVVGRVPRRGRERAGGDAPARAPQVRLVRGRPRAAVRPRGRPARAAPTSRRTRAASCARELRAEVARRWDLAALRAAVLRSQARAPRSSSPALRRGRPRALGLPAAARRRASCAAATTSTRSSGARGSTRPPRGERAPRATRSGIPIARPARSGRGSVRVRRRDPLDPLEQRRRGRRRALRARVDVQQHLLGRGEQRVVAAAVERVEDVQPLRVVAEDLRRRVQALLGARLAEVRDVRLDREVAAAGAEVERRCGAAARRSCRRTPAGSGSRARGRCSRSTRARRPRRAAAAARRRRRRAAPPRGAAANSARSYVGEHGARAEVVRAQRPA